MRKGPLALLAALAAVALIPRTLGILRAPRQTPPSDLRDSLGEGWSDLAALHDKTDLPGNRCLWCHLDMNPRSGRSAANDPSRWIASAGPAAAQLQPVISSICLSCHDGAVARAPVIPRRGGLDAAGDGGANHPVGIDYMAAYARFSGEYKHPAGNPEVRLEDGKVGCISCHQGHARNGTPGGPAGITQNTCLACHNR